MPVSTARTGTTASPPRPRDRRAGGTPAAIAAVAPCASRAGRDMDPANMSSRGRSASTALRRPTNGPLSSKPEATCSGNGAHSATPAATINMQCSTSNATSHAYSPAASLSPAMSDTSTPSSTTATMASPPWLADASSSTPIQSTSAFLFSPAGLPSAAAAASTRLKDTPSSSLGTARSSIPTSASSLRRSSKLTSIHPRQGTVAGSASSTSSSTRTSLRQSSSSASPKHEHSTNTAATPTSTSSAASHLALSPLRSYASIHRRLSENDDEQELLENDYDEPGYNAIELDDNLEDYEVHNSHRGDAIHDTLKVNAAAAAVLVMHALQSPAKIGSSPAKDRGLSRLFPPSPDGLPISASARAPKLPNARPKATRAHSSFSPSQLARDSAASASPVPFRRPLQPLRLPDAPIFDASIGSSDRSMPKKRFDMSDWQSDLAAIASAGSPGGPCTDAHDLDLLHAKTPTSRSFPTSLHGKSLASEQDLQQYAEDEQKSGIRHQPFRGSVRERPSQSSLSQSTATGSRKTRDPPSKLRRSSNIAFSQDSISSAAHSATPAAYATTPAHPFPALSTWQLSDEGRTTTVRPPLMHRNASHQSQQPASFGQAATQSLFAQSDHLQTMSSSASPFTASTRRSTRPSSQRNGHHRTHSRGHSSANDLKSLTASTSAGKFVPGSKLTSTSGSLDQIASSFNAQASAIRHRQRTMSISESEGDQSDSEAENRDRSASLPNSPDLEDGAQEKSQQSYLDARVFGGMSVVDDQPAKPLNASLAQDDDEDSYMDIDTKQDKGMYTPAQALEAGIDRSSPFFDTPGRSRGSFMPSKQSTYTLNASLPLHPFQPQLKSSRVSYPPKIMLSELESDDEREVRRAKNPLHSSVPASTRANTATVSTNSSKPLDQLFLASILNGSNLPPATGLRKQQSGNLSKLENWSSGGTIESAVLRPSKSLLPLSTCSVQGGRKRNANGAMVSQSHQTSPELRLATRSSRADLAKLASTRAQAAAITTIPDRLEGSGGRLSIDASTDEDSGISPTLPALTDSSSATSSLASSQRSQQVQPRAVAAPHVDGLPEDTSIAFDGDDSLLSDTSTSFAIACDSEMPYTFSRNTELSDATGELHQASGQLKSPQSPGLALPISRKASPHFKHVRPLQAAFSNSGLLSKKSARTRVERDSGIGLGGTPPASAVRRLLNREKMGENSSYNISKMSVDSSFSTPGHVSNSPQLSIAHLGSPVPTVQIAPSTSMELAEMAGNVSTASQPHRMPDTPCKRPPFQPHLRKASCMNNLSKQDTAAQGLHPLAQSSRPLVERSLSSCSSSASDSSSVVNSIPGSAAKNNMRLSDSPISARVLQNMTRTKAGVQQSSPSSGSPCARQTSAAKPFRRQLPPCLFRRRSSGQIQTAPDGTVVAISERSGGSIRTGTIDWEPMTPTRSSIDAPWAACKQRKHDTLNYQADTVAHKVPNLTTSPNAQALSSINGVPFSGLGVDSSMASPTSPLSMDSSHVHTKFGAVQPQQATLLPRPIASSNVGLQRPGLRARHSSSIVQTTRRSELSSPDRFSTSFSINRTLGQGEFSEAFEVQDRVTGQVFAVKKTKVPLLGQKARLRRLEEVDILRLMAKPEKPSPFVILLQDAWEQSGNLYIQTELCPYGNLAVFLEEYGQMYERLDEARVWKILAELAAGVDYIHSLGVLHLDLKPANVFISSAGSLKIGDFGLATRWPRVRSVAILQGAAVHSPGWDARIAANVWTAERGRSQSSDQASDLSDDLQDLEREGDREYIAPEILRGQYGKAADMFALGLIVLEAAANVMLPDNGLPWRKLREDDLSDVSLGHISDELLNVIVNLVRCNTTERTTIVELQEHPIVARLQQLRDIGQQMEAASETVSPYRQLSPSRRLTMAKGAIIEESPDFLHAVFAEVRQKWYSPKQTTLARPATQLTVKETTGDADMDVDS